MNDYEIFLRSKVKTDPDAGICGDVLLPEGMFDFQSDITNWALKRGRAALFAGTGLGKTLMAIAWGHAIFNATGGNVLILTPLAVAGQFVREGEKFGVGVNHCKSQVDVCPGVNVTNYEKLRHFDLSTFVGIVLDESSILKAYNGKTRTHLIESCQNIPYRLAATATPAPNDFMEIGNHAEFLGVMSYTDMLATFFVHDGGETQKWRLKGHAEDAFWKWLCSWAVSLQHPRDLGYPTTGFDLPALHQHQHSVDVEYDFGGDTLFPMEARTMQERLSARRHSVDDRVKEAAKITPSDGPFVWWCHLNKESEGLARLIPDAVEVRGSDKEDDKERKLIDFTEGRIRVLVTKPTICGFGMNWQHCSNTGYVGMSDSFEQVFQSIRRFWRFGQKNEVNVHFIASETEGAIVSNIRRKEADAHRMAQSMKAHMTAINGDNIHGIVRDVPDYMPTVDMNIPAWMNGRAQ